MFAASDHDRPWPSPSVTSACAGSSACSDPLGGPRRTRTSRSWCSATRCASSSAKSMRASPIALWIGRSSPPSPGCCRDGAGAPSSSRQRRSFAGTESSRGANGGAGDPLVALVGRPCPMSWVRSGIVFLLLIRCGPSHFLRTSSRCQRRSVSGVNRLERRSWRGRSRCRTVSTSRSSRFVFGWGTWRRSTASSWRSTSSSRSFERDDLQVRSRSRRTWRRESVMRRTVTGPVSLPVDWCVGPNQAADGDVAPFRAICH